MRVEFWQVLIGTSIRYIIFAGIAYFVFYILRNQRWRHRKIQPRRPSAQSIKTEVMFSASTIVIFATVIYLTVFSPLRSLTRIYDSVDAYGVLYLLVSFPLILLLHDTWFYWTHRLMHWKAIFPYVHKVHHLSHNPTPLAAFSFHPLEAIVEIGVLPVIAFILPVHSWILALFGIYMMASNVIGHLGFEIFPKWFITNKVTRMFTTSTHHNLHHRFGKGNYGLYFNFWDRLLGTSREDYESVFHAIVTEKVEDKVACDVRGKEMVVD